MTFTDFLFCLITYFTCSSLQPVAAWLCYGLGPLCADYYSNVVSSTVVIHGCRPHHVPVDVAGSSSLDISGRRQLSTDKPINQSIDQARETMGQSSNPQSIQRSCNDRSIERSNDLTIRRRTTDRSAINRAIDRAMDRATDRPIN